MKVSIEKIIKDMPKNLSDLEKAKYLYMEIGKVLSYKLEFKYCYDNRFQEDIYEEVISIEDIEKSDYQNKINIVCSQAGKIIQEALKKVNIKSYLFGYEPGEFNHIDVIANIDGKSYCLDIALDLANIQKGFQTTGFALKSKLYDGTKCDTLKKEEIKKIDEKLGYCKNGMYMNDVINMIKQELNNDENIKSFMKKENPSLNNIKITKDMILKYKIDFIYKYMKNNLEEENKMNIYEVRAYYRNIFRSILTAEEILKNNNYDFYYNEDGKIKNSSISEYDFKDELIYYIYNDKKRGYEKISNDDLKEISKNITFYELKPKLFYRQIKDIDEK